MFLIARGAKSAGGQDPWLYSPTWKAWIGSSLQSSVALTRTGKPTPSNYLHKQLDVTKTLAETNLRADTPSKGVMVRKKGLEPLRPFGHQLLRLARLPIPPLPRAPTSITEPGLLYPRTK